MLIRYLSYLNYSYQHNVRYLLFLYRRSESTSISLTTVCVAVNISNNMNHALHHFHQLEDQRKLTRIG